MPRYKAHKGNGVDVWLHNVEDYAWKVWNTPYCQDEMLLEDRITLERMAREAKRIREKYVET